MLDTLRLWQIALFSVALTAFYYVMLLGTVSPSARSEVTVAFVILAVLGVTMFQFSAKISYERISPWNSFMRTLPAPLWVRFGSRFLLVLIVGSGASGLLVAVGIVRFHLMLSLTTVLTVALSVPIAVAVFAPIGACIGGTLDPRQAPAVITILYLSTAWSSGVWTGGQIPRPLHAIDFLLPLPAIRNLARAIGADDWAGVPSAMFVVGAWVLGALMVARRVYRREESRAFT